MRCSSRRRWRRSGAPTSSGSGCATAAARWSPPSGCWLGLYGVVATLQPENEFGRVLAAYGGVFVVGSIAWGMAFDSFRPDRYDLAGAAICLLGIAVIMYAPR